MGQAGSDHSKSCGPTSLLRQGHRRAYCTRSHLDGSWVFPVRETPQPLCAIFPSALSLHSKEVPPYVQEELTVHQFLPTDCCALAQHQAEPGAIHWHPPLRCRHWWGPFSVGSSWDWIVQILSVYHIAHDTINIIALGGRIFQILPQTCVSNAYKLWQENLSIIFRGVGNGERKERSRNTEFHKAILLELTW